MLSTIWSVEVVRCHYSVLLIGMRLTQSPISVELRKFCDGADNVVQVFEMYDVL